MAVPWQGSEGRPQSWRIQAPRRRVCAPMKHALRTAALAAALTAAAAANAHDSWFEPLPGPGAPRLALGTGVLYPLQETAIAPEYLARSGCSAAGHAQALRVDTLAAHALHVTAPAGAQSCWAQTVPFDIELAPDKIDLYLREVNPPPALRALWQSRQARGLPWRERYAKHVRISLGEGSADDARPSPLAMDALIESRSPWVFRLLADGRPLAGQAVEFRSESSRWGLWRRTDAEGRVAFEPPLPGHWLLRAVDLQPAPQDSWASRFLALAFEVQNGSSLKSNSRSASQMAATSAISDEPPTNTPRR